MLNAAATDDLAAVSGQGDSTIVVDKDLGVKIYDKNIIMEWHREAKSLWAVGLATTITGLGTAATGAILLGVTLETGLIAMPIVGGCLYFIGPLFCAIAGHRLVKRMWITDKPKLWMYYGLSFLPVFIYFSPWILITKSRRLIKNAPGYTVGPVMSMNQKTMPEGKISIIREYGIAICF